MSAVSKPSKDEKILLVVSVCGPGDERDLVILWAHLWIVLGLVTLPMETLCHCRGIW